MQAIARGDGAVLRTDPAATDRAAGRYVHPTCRRPRSSARTARQQSLDDFEIAGFATLLGGAGAETVTKLIGTAAVTFARNPDQWQKLLDDRSKIPAAVEELLRYEAPGAVQRPPLDEGS